VHILKDNDGAFAWNNFAGSPDRFIVTESNSNFKAATVWAGSHPMVIQLACVAVRND
jgi:predicted nuclease of predicted toxin-antitoxin system